MAMWVVVLMVAPALYAATILRVANLPPTSKRVSPAFSPPHVAPRSALPALQLIFISLDNEELPGCTEHGRASRPAAPCRPRTELHDCLIMESCPLAHSAAAQHGLQRFAGSIDRHAKASDAIINHSDAAQTGILGEPNEVAMEPAADCQLWRLYLCN